jgi:hypothetical protein
MNFTASSIVKIARGQISEVTRLHQAYFSKLFENSLTPAEWRQLLVGSGLEDVVVLTCRPFPLLAIGGFSERVYIEALKILLPLWRWFDRTDLPILNNLGWMYLAYGIKQAKK